MPKSLTSEALEKLLKTFSDDKMAAATAYADLRDSLLRFFQLRGISDPDEAADETLDRIPERINPNTKKDDVKFIAFSIAKFVFLEKIRQEQKQKAAADGFYQQRGTPKMPGDADGYETLRECLKSLYDRERALLLEYFTDLPSQKLAAHRQQMAARENMDLNTLRNRISRLRKRLEDCVSRKK